MNTETNIELDIESIGSINMGIDGTDQYLLVKTTQDNDVPVAEIERVLTERYYRDTHRPGGYFCHSVSVMQKPYSSTEFIAIVHHRYDV